MAVVLSFGLAPIVPLHAQDPAEPDKWKVSGRLSYTGQSGNKVLRLFTGGFSASHLREEEFEFDAGWTTRYGKSEGELVAFNHNAAVAFDFRPEDRWSPFLFADAERDELKRLDVRVSSGAGVKRTFVSRGNDDVSLSLAALWSYERIAPPMTEDGIDPPDVAVGVTSAHVARYSLRGRIRFEPRDGVRFTHTTFYQPIWNEMANYLLRSDTGLNVMLTERLSLLVEHQTRRDSRPPTGVDPNDLLLTTGIIIEL